MPALTIKNIPDTLYEQLKFAAELWPYGGSILWWGVQWIRR